MGKGDQRSRRGKIFAGSYGKSRPKPKSPAFVPQAKVAAPTAVKEKAKPRVAKKAAAVKAAPKKPEVDKAEAAVTEVAEPETVAEPEAPADAEAKAETGE